MTIIKRLSKFLLITIIAFSFLTITACGDREKNDNTTTLGDVFDQDGITYEIVANQLEIISASRSAGEVVIPSTVNGYNVVKIGEEAFKNKTDLIKTDLIFCLILFMQ